MMQFESWLWMGRWKMMQAIMQNGGKSGNDDAIDDVIGGEFGL